MSATDIPGALLHEHTGQRSDFNFVNGRKET